MKWSDEGIVVNVKTFNEKAYVLTLFCKENGKKRGLFQNSKSQNGAALISVGDIGQALWFGRLQDQLGKFSFERKHQTSLYCFQCSLKNAVFNHLYDIINILPDSHTYPKLYELFYHINIEMQHFNSKDLIIQICLFELLLLSELGFGFDFSHCAVSGVSEVFYISPQSGQCVSREIGIPYHSKLFIIPCFWKKLDLNEDQIIEDFALESPQLYQELQTSLRITEFFLKKHIFEKAKNFSFSRQKIIQWINHSCQKNDSKC
ncbi:MAG: DNA repair protein RecO [Candidatus Puniceispirillum sp.]|nr:DNA repair protein RecO [Candidatus Pelagibacter sp.]MBA4282711.1 DNA repair protein RecO [Candidatus Puniceispirillum sp.]